MTGDEVGFGEISDVHRNERRSKVLAKLPPHFHEKAEAHLQKLRKEHCAAIQVPGNPAAMMLWDQISKVDKRMGMINEMRERKIALAALDRINGAAPPENMTKKEMQLYNTLVETFSNFRKGIEVKVEKECVQPFHTDKAVPEPEPINVQSTIVAPSPVAAEPAPETQETTVVHVLADIPEFAGLSADYELKKDDMVTLPSQFASLLSSRGLVRIVSG